MSLTLGLHWEFHYQHQLWQQCKQVSKLKWGPRQLFGLRHTFLRIRLISKQRNPQFGYFTKSRFFSPRWKTWLCHLKCAHKLFGKTWSFFEACSFHHIPFFWDRNIWKCWTSSDTTGWGFFCFHYRMWQMLVLLRTLRVSLTGVFHVWALCPAHSWLCLSPHSFPVFSHLSGDGAVWLQLLQFRFH